MEEEKPFCLDCGTCHSPLEECDYIIIKCNSCGETHKDPPDVTLCNWDTTVCGQCGTVGAWEFLEKGRENNEML